MSAERVKVSLSGTRTSTRRHQQNDTEISLMSCWQGFQLRWKLMGKMFIILLEKIFEKSALFISRKPFAVVFFTLFIAFACTVGFIHLNAESNVKYLYLPENSEASKDIKRANENGFNLEVRQEEVIILPKKNKTVLSKECMAEMIDIHEKIVQIARYEEYCYRHGASGKCVITNLLELFDYSKDKLYNISGRIQSVSKNDSFLMSNGRRLRDNFNSIFGKKVTNDPLFATNALRMVYFMTEYTEHDKNRDGILNWEKTFIGRMSTLSDNTTCAQIVYTAERSLDDSVEESTGSDIKFFAVTFTIMGIFSSVVNGRCGDSHYGHQLLGSSALISIYLGVTSAFGLLMFAGVPFVNMVGVLPFLVVSIGIDDVFIILHELNEVVRENLPAIHMLSNSMANSGPTITMTTLTDLVAFAVSCRSLFPAARYFCVYAAVSITFAFVMLVTFFVACMWFDIKRMKNKRHGFLPCLKSNPSTACCSNIRRNALDKVMRAWGRVLTSTSGKIVVCLFSVFLLAGGVYGALHVDESFSRQLLTTKESHYRKFLDVYEQHFNLDIEVSLIVPGKHDYSDPEFQRKYSDLEMIAKDNDHYQEKTLSWLSEFSQWAAKQNTMTNRPENFYDNLHHFLSLPSYRRFVQDVRFSEDKSRITSSRIVVYSKSNPNSNFQRDMMTSLREDLTQDTNLEAFAVAQPFVYFEQYAYVLDETIKNLIIAGISILLISSLFLNHPIVILCLFLGFVAIVLELLGLMYIWDVSINSISMINLLMALGFSVDYNAHVAYHFVSSKAQVPEHRAVDALGRVGGSVFLGGLSTLLGMITTGFASSIVFQIFFKMFIGIVVLGLVHGLVILPVYLSLIGKLFDLQEISLDMLLKKLYNQKSTHKTSSTGKTEHENKLSHRKSKFSPVAVVGIGCRFPGGANSKDKFWNMLLEGKCGITSYPMDRPDAREFEEFYHPGKDVPGKHYVLNGAFLDEINGFDAQFFGVSSTESSSIDPQQRLLLHVVYEAIEDAGLRLEDLQQCRTGVYVGLMNLDYGYLLLDSSNIRRIDQFASTGITSSVAANRISFLFNFTGPSLAVDTACSSSLTALHLAFGHLQTGECDVAIVCAPNILLNGGTFHIACCRAGMLAADGRCKSFDIKGDGYGRGEGVAAVVLKPCSTAIRDRDDMYAEIVASGLNNDGQNSIPMTSPCEVTQATLFQRVLQESGLSKDDIQYIEAHGTGTAIGDVVEMASISTVYGNSTNRVLRVGSVKSNVNHTESTAGLAGLIKTCLMIKHECFVPTINVHEVKPQLKMSERKMMVQVQHEPWTSEDGKPRVAAVCSYGYGGANAHLIIKQVTREPVPLIPSRQSSNRIMTLTARSDHALKALAEKFSQSLKIMADDNELLKDNICYSLNERYTVHSHRLAVSFRSLKQAARALDMFCEQEKGWQEMVTTGHATTARTNVAFLYGGQGVQWYGMAKEMIEHEPRFKESIERIDHILQQEGVPWSLMLELTKTKETSRVMENPVGQTALFAVHVALTELLKTWGIAPSAVLGHSLGEISAAWASESLSLHEALRLVLIRSRLHENCSSTGIMAAVRMSPQKVEQMLRDLHLENVVDIAVINSPGDVVLSGDKESMQVVERHIREELNNVFWKTLDTTRAFHSNHMEEMKGNFFDHSKEVKLRPCRGSIPFYSTVTGLQTSGRLLSWSHWWKNIRQTVNFSPALQNMFTDGYRTFIEINAGPQLARHVHQLWSHQQTAKLESNSDVVVIQTLPRRSANEQHRSFLQNCAAHLFTSGVLLSWNRIQGSGSKYFIRRPTYPWQESEFWYRDKRPQQLVHILGDEKHEQASYLSSTDIHLLLGKAVPTKAFSGLHAWETEVDLYKVPYLADHAFSSSPDPVIPAAVYVEMVFAMVLHMFPRTAINVRNMSFNNLLTISTNDSFKFRTRFHDKQSWTTENCFQITKVEEDENEVVVSEGYVSLDFMENSHDADNSPAANVENFQTFKTRMVQSTSSLEKKRKLAGFQFGPQFDLIREAWSNDDEALAMICATDEICNTSSAYVIHPCIIDACFQSFLLVQRYHGKFVPYQIGEITVLRKEITSRLFSHVKAVHREGKTHYNITLMNCYGTAVMLLNDFVVVDFSSLTTTNFDTASFMMEWKEEYLQTSEPQADETDNKTWLVLRDQGGIWQRLTEYLPPRHTVVFLDFPGSEDKISPNFSEALKDALKKREAQPKSVHGKDENLIILNFWPVDTSRLKADCDNFVLAHKLSFESSLLTVQEILMKGIAAEVQLVFVTSGVVSLPNPPSTSPGCCECNEIENSFPWSGSLFGFRRTLCEEIRAMKASVIDLPQDSETVDFQHMAVDLQQAVIGEEIAYRNGLRYVSQLKKLNAMEKNLTIGESPIDKSGKPRPFKLSFMSGKFFLRGINEAEPGNECPFLEVFFARPLLTTDWATLESRDHVIVAGKLRIGETNCKSENLVVGLCEAGSLGNYIAADQCCLSPIMDNISVQQAASFWVPMAVYYYFIKDILAVVKGSNVLVYHREEATCCVFASVVLAVGAHVFSLARNKQAKERLRHFGIPTVFTEDELIICEELNDVQLDAVCLLSKPSGTIFRKIMNHLKSRGTIVTISDGAKTKFDIPDSHKDVKFIMTSLDDVTKNSETLSSLLTSATSVMVSSKYFQKLLELPQVSSSIYDIAGPDSARVSKELSAKIKSNEVFHTVSFKPNFVPKKFEFYRLPFDSDGLRRDRTYLVIGGIRGFGFEVARWMVENGAKTVMCTARSPPSEEEQARTKCLERRTNSRILLRQADVTSWKDMNVIREELESLPNIAGIIFSAMVLQDQIIQDADLKTCERVVSTKIQGGVLLHQLSLSMDLDFFIMFSSIASALGNVGQVAYAAANAFLDHLCEYRRYKLGLPGLSVNWGPISGAGVLERFKDVAALLEQQGFSQLPHRKAMDFLKRFLVEYPDQAEVCLCDINWPTYLSSHVSSRLQLLRDEIPLTSQLQSMTTLKDLALLPLEGRVKHVEEFVKGLLSAWSGADTNEVDLNVGLYKYGIDSIGAANISIQILNGLGASFENYYIIQPKTNGRSIIKDILLQIEQESKQLKEQTHEENMTGFLNDTDPTLLNDENHNKDGIELGTNNVIEEKIIPIYVPDEAVVKVFMMHSSHKYAPANAPFALGFQEQTLVALYSIGLGDFTCHTSDYGTVPMLARRYMELIQKEQSTGPYYIAGYSFGGTLAYEIASLLTQQDEEVAMVFMLDTRTWIPKSLANSQKIFQAASKRFLEYENSFLVKKLISKLAFARLGMVPSELDVLYNESADEEEVIAILEEKALEKNVELHLREEVSSLLYQHSAAMAAHYDWQPSEIRYKETITYLRCEDTRRIPFFWEEPHMWRTLTGKMDLFWIHGDHFLKYDEFRAKVCGSMMMTTAAMKYRTTYSMRSLLGLRSSSQERLVDWIKQGVDISMYSRKVCLTLVKGTLSLDQDENWLTFVQERPGFSKTKRIVLRDLHNILPGKYVDAIQKKKLPDIDLIVCMTADKGKLHKFRCSDRQQRDQLMDALDTIFEIPFLRIKN